MVVGCARGVAVGYAGGVVVVCRDWWLWLCKVCWGHHHHMSATVVHWCTLVYRSADGIVLCYGQCCTSSLNLVVSVEAMLDVQVMAQRMCVCVCCVYDPPHHTQ